MNTEALKIEYDRLRAWIVAHASDRAIGKAKYCKALAVYRTFIMRPKRGGKDGGSI